MILIILNDVLRNLMKEKRANSSDLHLETVVMHSASKIINRNHDRKQIWRAMKVSVFQMIYEGCRLALLLAVERAKGMSKRELQIFVIL
ncbi:Uncharacterized protein BM_BM13479 [Brugia malayi]|uniref:Bm13479 n=1 Tax=Brugia malayi TaxID=6279 RepID=A0A0K0IXY5_BRUMA|nr:Uncharacterized protein BM_BM13479 [Brugia malayi]CDP96784.1 Bm13479 [Brugia malayi]VIO94268.1 Uncharacterized protein BM_BM13479 [Brugia malayi]